MTEKPDYYLLLGLPRSASQEEIRRAYFDAARRLHPDVNTAPGETEFFLGAQEAYETLADPIRRAKYDATLPPEKAPSMPVQQTVFYSRQNLLKQKEPQLIYVLLELTPSTNLESVPTPPLNLCLILDRSTSMQGQNMDVVKSTAIQILRRMRPHDTFSVVAFSDRAEVVIPAVRNADLTKMEARIQMLQNSGGTELFQGLESGFQQVSLFADKAHINHMILLTDGRTYGDEDKCRDLAARAAEKGIGISGLGIGYEWNDTLLDELGSKTGGNSMYVSRPEDIQHLLLEKFNHLWQIYAEEARLDFQCGKGIELRYAFRTHPETGLLPLESPLHLGPILRNDSLKILMELFIQPEVCQENVVMLMDGKLELQISTLPVKPPMVNLHLARPVTNIIDLEPPPHEILDALSLLTLYRMQEQARLEVAAGEYDQASAHLQRMATHLIAQGKKQLAQTALLEAEHILVHKSYSKEGDKKIKYGTRALLLPGKEQNA
jgi:Ca-activated chloride channel family protein